MYICIYTFFTLIISLFFPFFLFPLFPSLLMFAVRLNTPRYLLLLLYTLKIVLENLPLPVFFLFFFLLFSFLFFFFRLGRTFLATNTRSISARYIARPYIAQLKIYLAIASRYEIRNNVMDIGIILSAEKRIRAYFFFLQLHWN